ncbi:MAG: hypothetical protein U1F77_15795 [Kiritimatiellia bacterium]
MIFGGTGGLVSLGAGIEATALTATATGYTLGSTPTLSGTPAVSVGAGLTATATTSLISTVNVGLSGGGTFSTVPGPPATTTD